MSVSLDLEGSGGVLTVGLSWDFMANTPKVDLDASAVCFSSTGTLVDAAYFNQLNAVDGAIVHSGDCTHGKKEGFDEQITINIAKLTGVQAIVFLLSAFEGGNLKNCESSMCEVLQGGKPLTAVSAGGPETGSKTGLILFMLYKDQDRGEWQLKKINQPVNARHFAACITPMREIVDSILDPGCLFERQLTNEKTFKMTKGDSLLLPAGLTRVTVGLGWDTSGCAGIDLDASCLYLADVDNDGDLDPVDGVYFGQKSKPGVTSSGDNTTGAGDGDDETLIVDLAKVPKKITTLAFCINIYSQNMSFANVKNAYVRLFDTRSGHELARYALVHDKLGSKTGLIFCLLTRGKTANDPWSLLSVGEACDGRRLMEISSPLWDGKWSGQADGTATMSSGGSGDPCCVIA
ncbi:TerD domain-containing protein [Ochromonadaceae sp. CCMP2298]|nr:TerD domain-containing protein [Ochromonadaceae sp. CCMP2298]